MNTALTIAGSDSSGGAGIQADLKTFACNGVYGMSAITALTAQNTTGVFGILEVESEFLFKQIEATVTDIFPDATKIGMVSSPALIQTISKAASQFKLKNIVVDPVMVATSGAKLISDEGILALSKELFPLAALITPNIPESEILCGFPVKNERDMEKAAECIAQKHGVSVLLKGGHSVNDANDFLYSEKTKKWFNGKKIGNPNTHGTGCTLSSAIAANLAKGHDIETAVFNAKEYLSNALMQMLDLGKGSGPLMHNFALR